MTVERLETSESSEKQPLPKKTDDNKSESLITSVVRRILENPKKETTTTSSTFSCSTTPNSEKVKEIASSNPIFDKEDPLPSAFDALSEIEVSSDASYRKSKDQKLLSEAIEDLLDNYIKEENEEDDRKIEYLQEADGYRAEAEDLHKLSIKIDENLRSLESKNGRITFHPETDEEKHLFECAEKANIIGKGERTFKGSDMNMILASLSQEIKNCQDNATNMMRKATQNRKLFNQKFRVISRILRILDRMILRICGRFDGRK